MKCKLKSHTGKQYILLTNIGLKDILCARNKECHDGGSWAGEREEESRTVTAAAYGRFVSRGFWTRRTGGKCGGAESRIPELSENLTPNWDCHQN